MTNLAEASVIERIAVLDPEQREELLGELDDAMLVAFLTDWKVVARPKQLPPDSDWGVWIIRAGRGFGKTRTGAEWVHGRAMDEPGRWIALIAKTPADARDYMIEGPGGILRNVPKHERPTYEPSKRRLTWPNGSWATIYSSEEPDQLRGFSGDTAWLDEFAKYKNPKEVWEALDFGMREISADRPRRIITTTPRPTKVLLEIEADPDTVVTVGSSYENRSNLDPKWYEKTIKKHEGTRLGRQEIHAEILEDVEGALWTSRLLDRTRHKGAPPEDLVSIVVGVDPSVSSGENSAETGIVVVGKDIAGHGYVLEDASVFGTPERWTSVAVKTYHKWKADLIVGEVNNGGDLIETLVRVVDPKVNYEKVHASRGKITRAEPVSALSERDEFHLCGVFTELEEQLTTYVPGMKSPDRMDAMVWAATRCVLNDVPVDDLLLGRA